MTSKCKQLRALIESNTLEFILEAHNGISATIVEQAGFKAIWGSGFAMSAQFGVRDSNEASWTQVVDIELPPIIKFERPSGILFLII